MNSSTISFIAWAVFMLAMVGVLIYAARHSRHAQEEAEDMASTALPEIGHIAEKKHKQRFGRASTSAPGTDDSWYPEVKKKSAKASGG